MNKFLYYIKNELIYSNDYQLPTWKHLKGYSGYGVTIYNIDYIIIDISYTKESTVYYLMLK